MSYCLVVSQTGTYQSGPSVNTFISNVSVIHRQSSVSRSSGRPAERVAFLSREALRSGSYLLSVIVTHPRTRLWKRHSAGAYAMGKLEATDHCNPEGLSLRQFPATGPTCSDDHLNFAEHLSVHLTFSPPEGRSHSTTVSAERSTFMINVSGDFFPL